ncbi:MAG TPA: IclR family transcriptional regulator [Zeimonas sp.]
MRNPQIVSALVEASSDASQKSSEVPAGSAILRAIRVMETIAESEVPPHLADLCRTLGLPKPTVFRILSTLEYAGLVAREPGSKRYRSGRRLTRLSGAVLLNSPSCAARRAILEELVEQTGETCNLSVPDGHCVVYLDRVEADWPLRVSLTAGSCIPLCASASGKLFLGAMSRRSRERLIRQCPLIRHTPQTLDDPGRLEAEIERVQQQGYATDNEEYLPGVCCVAVPVVDADGRVVAALSLHAPLSRLSLDEALQFLPAMRSAAVEMAQTIDW